MFKNIMTFIMLVAITAALWLISFSYDNLTLDKTLYSFVVVTISYLFFKLLMEGAVAKRIKDKRTRYTFRKTTQILFIFIAFILILRIWVLNPQALLVAYGLIAAGIAIALQDVFKNFAGAIAIFLTGIYRVGDRIEINSKFGDVMDIGLFYTTLLELREWVDGDQATGRISLLPNGQVLSSTVNNYTKDHQFIWDEIAIPVTYDSNWGKAVEIIETAVKNETVDLTKRAEGDIYRLEEKYYLSKRNIEPKIYITPTDNWVMMRVRYVADTRDRRIIQHNLSEKILKLIEKESDIKIASQTMTITTKA